jgi:succinate dehydrogenase / fumarate reductase flavoprotein subunit
VSGKRAGKYAAQYARDRGSVHFEASEIDAEKERLETLFKERPSGGISPIKLKKRIRAIMSEQVGVLRSDRSLKAALEEVQRMKGEDLKKVSLSCFSRRFNREWVDAVDVFNMVQLAESIIRPALMREESRGAHYREDYPQSDNKNWLKHISLSLARDKLSLNTYPVDLREMSPEGKEK